MTKLFASALALTIGATGAWADNHNSGDMSDNASANMWNEDANLIRSRDITGGNIYTTDAASDEDWGWDTEAAYTEVGTDWEQIGEIEDLVLNESGEMIGIVAEVGGFLDIGDKHVMISIDDVSLVAVDDATYSLVTRLSEEELEELNGVDEAFWN